MTRPNPGVLGALAVLTIMLATPARAEPPDLTGLWFPHLRNNSQTPEEAPFNDFGRRLAAQYNEQFEHSNDPAAWCIKPGLPRSIWGAPFPVEIHHTDTYITMFWEGYFQYRKIWLEGHDYPEPVLHSTMGHSVGRWEGDTLVVETSHLREFPNMRDLPNTEDARVVERIRVEQRTGQDGETTRYLTNELTLTDPRLYTEPVTVYGELRWSPDTPIMDYSCSEEIYENHLEENNLQLPDFDQ